MTPKTSLFFLAFLLAAPAGAAAPAVAVSSPSITIVYPPENHTMAMASGEVIFGSVSHPKGVLKVNGQAVKVHRLGGWVAFPPVSPGTFTFLCELELPNATTSVTRTIQVLPRLAQSPPIPVRIDPEARLPSSDLELRPGEWLQVQFKGSTGGRAEFTIGGGKKRLPMAEYNQALGLYQGVYQIRLEDVFEQAEIEFHLKGADGTSTAKAKGRLTVRDTPQVAVVRSSGAVVIKTGPGAGYLTFPPVGTRMLLAGRQGSEAKVYLNPTLSGWIDANLITLLPPGTIPPRAVVGSVRLTAAEDGTTASIGASDTVPFTVEESADLRSVTIRLYNAVGYTNWIIYDSSDTFVRQVQWKQEDTNTAALTFHLEPEHRLWGYDTRWEGGSLRLELRRAPRFAPKGQSVFKGRTIVVDAGHMPSAHGAVGPRGVLEKDVNLAIAKALEDLLKREGATVVMTRAGEEEVGLVERPKLAWERRGELFISVHNNALPDGEDPFAKTRGFSIFYYQPHSFAFAEAVHRSYRRRIPLPDEGLRYGNLLVARMTQMPSILTESAYLILPEQEALLQAPSFQRRLGRAMLEGARAFLEAERDRASRAPRPQAVPAPEPEPDPSAALERQFKDVEKPKAPPRRKPARRKKP